MKLLHSGDLHIGLESYGRVNPKTGLNSRFEDFILSLRHLSDTAVTENVDAVILTGDIYKDSNPTHTHQKAFAEFLMRLVDAGIPVVIVTGNHDIPVSFGKATSVDVFRTVLSDHIHVVEKPVLLKIKTRSGILQVAAFPWPTRSNLLTKEDYRELTPGQIVLKIQELGENVLKDLADHLSPDYPAVLAAHITTTNAVFSGTEKRALVGNDPVFSPGTLADSRFDYVALGHIHKFQDLNAGNQPPVVYSGSIERIDFGEEREEKGAVIVSLAGKGNASYRFVKSPARQFTTILVEVQEGENPTAILKRRIKKAGVKDKVVKIFYTLASEEQAALLDFKTLHESLKDCFFNAGIVRRVAFERRSRRAPISEELGTMDALKRYIESRPSLKKDAWDLVKYARKVEETLERDTQTS